MKTCKLSKQQRRARLRRITNREYRESSESGGVKILVRDAEYEIETAEVRLCRIVRGPDGWRAVVANTGSSSFGLPVSPVGMNLLRDVKAWAIETLCAEWPPEIPGGIQTAEARRRLPQHPRAKRSLRQVNQFFKIVEQES